MIKTGVIWSLGVITGGLSVSGHVPAPIAFLLGMGSMAIALLIVRRT